ncbi:hypothetical protein CROQUDRAFT_43576 [Cronartium quercuum f. sp. fusiforme G11]|uniref:DNA-directed RNA polymerase III subunit RPC3 n=1 Tax=Cronartium quercuum f. sp. fusiforme G11 TaxID=708437 RepID=A0A9P6TC58_9BASI|nr:hypothetical protein CROQUDRAFT_43576 [Cronartium quercuum f. sp. fusiforme G11]
MYGPQDIRLCEHLLTYLYGHACGEIGSLLLQRGRLPFVSLVRMSSLTAHSIRAALITLIQQNCVCHSETSAAAPPPTTTTINTSSSSSEFFEAVPNEILSRIRFGKYLAITDDLFGPESRSVIECVLENGKIRIGQLVSMLISNYDSCSKNLSEHEKKTESAKSEPAQILKSNVLNLLAERFLKPSRPAHSVTSLDLELAWEKQMIAELTGVPTAKDLRAVKERLAEKVVVEENREFQEMCSFDLKKRKSATDSNRGPTKRSKVEETLLDDDMFVRVNYDRFNIKIRNSIFEQECLRSYNTEAAFVMRAMLGLAEGKQRDCGDLVSADPISAQSIVIKLGDKAKKLKSCFPPRAANGQFNLKLKNTGDLAAELLSILAKQDDLGNSSGSVFVAGSLDKLLGQVNPIGIVSEKKGNGVLGGGGSGGGGIREFNIEYGKYSVELRKALVSRIVRETFGVEAARVVRILMLRGRLDEKHLAKFAMMTAKDSRELCLRLSASNILELQEVPKTQDRQPSRTYYLFFIDFKKLILNLTAKLRKSQTNVIERIYHELENCKTLLAKVNRKDVYEDLETFLSVWEKAELERLKARLEALEVAKMRLERDVFILRDLPWVG